MTRDELMARLRECLAPAERECRFCTNTCTDCVVRNMDEETMLTVLDVLEVDEQEIRNAKAVMFAAKRRADEALKKLSAERTARELAEQNLEASIRIRETQAEEAIKAAASAGDGMQVLQAALVDRIRDPHTRITVDKSGHVCRIDIVSDWGCE